MGRSVMTSSPSEIAPFVRLAQTDDHVENGGLPSPIGPQQAHDLAGADFYRDAFHDLAGAKTFYQSRRA